MSYQTVFNQYYIDLLKRLKTESKKLKESEDQEKCNLGKKITKSIKENYMTIDKSSDTYIKYANKLNADFWTSYLETENTDDWLQNDVNPNVEIFHNITMKEIFDILNDIYLFHHFITVFYIFKDENSEEEIANILKYLQELNSDISIDDIKNENHQKVLKRLKEIRHKQVKESTGINLKGIENTTIGKLAKEILEDVDVEKIQKSIGENGDVLKAIGDPDSGFTDLIANVSRKMATKISNGELKQENLMQDAIQFASVLPGMFGMNNTGDKSQNTPDMSGMMDMMSKMMGNKNNMDMFKNMAEQMKTPRGTRNAVNTSGIKKKAYANKLKAKLEKKHKENS